MMEENYLEINRKAWDQRTSQHLTSSFYGVDYWLDGGTSLKSIEIELLGNLEGKSVLHLMCHFGQDSLSISREGAAVTGLDLSPAAISAAKELAQKAQLKADFICGNIYDAPSLIDQKFDIVFMSYGTVGWLPDIQKWAEVVAHFIKPKGRFVFAEFHPALWMLDNNFKNIEYRYFTGSGAIIENEGTYTDVSEKKENTMIGWNHGLADVINALKNQGLSLETFDEYDYSPYPIFDNLNVEVSPGEWCIKGIERKLPLVYSLSMQKQV